MGEIEAEAADVDEGAVLAGVVAERAVEHGVQHVVAEWEHQRKLAGDIDATVRSQLASADRGPGTSATATVRGIVPPLVGPAGTARRR
ncbi:hypothetical protein [Streptomyces marianii]|uniref:Uncharacterized protein n=1 Tax=Streptomyces marianii TaxID=1817406 RepID=A0A5R9E8Z5_9ACTN|nr:hypothetical protein [Streptomyces marianii]TLQ44694.1 hypothetical protein FEF34_17765 [Streptomyces marianii]